MKKKPKRSRPRKSLWSPKKGLTNSSIQSWLKCREQFALRYIDGWSTKKLSIPLAYGNLWHAADEHWGEEEPWKHVEAASSKQMAELAPKERAELAFLLAQVKTLYPIYQEHYCRQDAGLRWVNREKTFAIPMRVLGLDLTIRGKRDGEYLTPKGSLALFETKTKTRIDPNGIRDQLRCDFQTLLYSWSLWKEGRAPDLIVYNVVRRPGLRKKEAEPLQAYLERLAKDCRSKKSGYFARWKVQVSPGECARFEREHLLPILQAFVTWWREVRRAPFLPERLDGRHPSHYLSLPALVGPYGKDDLYDLVVNGYQDLYFRRSSAHPELFS